MTLIIHSVGLPFWPTQGLWANLVDLWRETSIREKDFKLNFFKVCEHDLEDGKGNLNYICYIYANMYVISYREAVRGRN